MTYPQGKKKSALIVMGDLPRWKKKSKSLKSGLIVMGDLPRKDGLTVMGDLPR